MFTALSGPPRVQGSPNLIVERRTTNTSPVDHIYDVLDAQGKFQVQEGSPEVLLPPHRSLSNHTRSPAGSQFEQPGLPLGNLTENINEHFLTDTTVVGVCPGIVGHLPQSKIHPKKRWGPRGEDFESAIILRVILGIILRIIGCPIQELCIPA